MSGQITLANALERIETNSIKERTEGVTELKRILRSNNRFDSLDDISFHRMYEVLFRVAITEQSEYVKAKASKARSAAETRLSSCAHALRLAVEAGVRHIKLRTVKAVLDHVSGTLLLSNGTFCEPLALDYAKVMSALLGYQVHVEHLSRNDWERVALFFVECLKSAESELADDDTVPGAEMISTTGMTNGLSHRSSRSNVRDAGGSQSGRSFAKQVAREIVACMALLTSPPNANCSRKSPELLSALIQFLQNSKIAGGSYQNAFAAINRILSWTRTERVDITRTHLSKLIRLIKHCWISNNSPRGDIITTCIYLRPYVLSSLQQHDHPALRSEVRAALDTMRNEYGVRKEREQLHLDDVRLDVDPAILTKPSRIGTAVFSLRCAKARAELNWTTAYILAFFSNVLDNSDTGDASSSDEDETIHQRPRKRQRLSNEIDDALASSVTGSIASRTCALQILAFLGQQRAFSTRQLTKMLDKLSISCAEDHGTISSWSYIALASIAAQVRSTDSSVGSRWLSIWQFATRSLSNASTCRTASHLLGLMLNLRLVPQQNVTEIVQSMTESIDLNGPTVLADSVVNLLRSIVSASQQISPATSSATTESVLTWLLRNFSPSKFEDRAYASQHVLLEARHVADLVAHCLGQPLQGLSLSQFVVWESVGQVWLECTEQEELMRYLLLLPQEEIFIHDHTMLLASEQNPNSQPKVSLEALVLTHLINELYNSYEIWQRLLREKLVGLSIDAFTFLASACVTATCIAFDISFRDTRRQNQLQKQVHEILNAIAEFIGGLHCQEEKVDAMLVAVSSVLSGLDVANDGSKHLEHEAVLCDALSKGMAGRSTNLDINGRSQGEDTMDLEDVFDSQGSRQDTQSSNLNDIRNEYASSFSAQSLRSSMTTYASIIFTQKEHLTSTTKDTAVLSKGVVDYLLSLSESNILLSRSVITALSHLGVELGADDAYRLLDHCSETMLQSYVYERSEVAIGAILDIMSSLAVVWTNSANKALFDLGVDMYDWYTRIALTGGVLSPSVQKRVANLLLQLCHVDTNYPGDDDVSSARTSLFKVLQLGNISVQFYLAHRISPIFSLYVLAKHSAMFNDLQESLPADTEHSEGMAMRLLFLSELGSAWHSLLRQCVYYIFETAGTVKHSIRYAERNMEYLATALRFSSPQDLFRLFAPQLLHSWLEKHTVASLPFAIFRYDSLYALITRHQAEITAQLLMRGNDEGMEFVAKALKSTTREIVSQSFAKCQAYCIGWDVSQTPTSTNEASSESRLRKIIDSKEEYKALVTTQFPVVMAQFFLCVQQDDVEDKWLEKRAQYSAASEALRETKSYSHSDRSLPESQQPSFRSKLLCDQIERLCRRTGHSPVNPWDASSLSLAVRILLESLEDALGPLYTCTTIRRLRLLVCMSGDIALSGYCIEMLIHTLRPFLNESQCADDTMGLLQYLFHHGAPYFQLPRSLRFLYGTTVLMVLQMQKHSGATLDSTTQESQHKSTVQKMRVLQSWLVNYLQRTVSSNDALTTQDHADLAKSLTDVALPGNAIKGSPESALLLLLLNQEGTEEVTLSNRDRDEALTLLSNNFGLPQSNAEDCLADDADCVKFASPLWRALLVPKLSESFVMWTSRVLGRAYASTGDRPFDDSKTGQRQLDELSAKYEGLSRSQANIAQCISASLFSRLPREASIADHTLRSVLVSFRDAEEALAFEQMLPESVVSAVSQGTYGHQPQMTSESCTGDTRAKPLTRLLEPSTQSTLDAWTQSVLLSLCRGATAVAILPALIPALTDNAALALELLPSVIHILLCAEHDKEPVLRTEMSKSISEHLSAREDALKPKQQFLIQLLLYLRSQPLPGERTKADRLRWLEVDWLMASQAAVHCNMPTTALLFAESASSTGQNSRRTSSRASMSQISIAQVPQDLLLSVFEAIEEPDSFYGVEQPATLQTVLDRLDYEADGYRSLMFRSAQTDTHLRQSHQFSEADSTGMVRSLSMLNLDSLTFALLSRGLNASTSADELTASALRLQQWDILSAASESTGTSACFGVFQKLSRATEGEDLQSQLRSAVSRYAEPMTVASRLPKPSHQWFSALASLTEMSEIMDCSDAGSLRSHWTLMRSRQSWMFMAPYGDFRSVLSSRQTMFSVMSQNKAICLALRVSPRDCQIVEIESALCLSRLAREHDQIQEALIAMNQAGSMVKGGRYTGIKAEAAVKFETASVLWKSGETSASVKMLQDTLKTPELYHQDVAVGKSGLLAQLAHQLADARLEKPDEILNEYLKPAISELNNRSQGEEAGKVFYEFASFCDKQLQNPGNREDFNRVSKLRQKKQEEVEELDRLSKAAKRSGGDVDQYKKPISKARQWLEIDDADYKRLRRSRDTFLLQSLQNYMLALTASDEHDISILRFFALWLEHSDVADANTTVGKYLASVPSWKFVVLMNQLMSRLEQDNSAFQGILRSLAARICSDHPHHSLHHLYASTRKPPDHEEAALSRYRVAAGIRQQLRNDPKAVKLLENIFRADRHYTMLAMLDMKDHKSRRVTVKEIPIASALSKSVPSFGVPPATISLSLRPSCDYGDVPTITRFGSIVELMSGLSRPKKLTAYASNGQAYMQLFKSGDDDLRQDAIMEQVFEEVSKMLRNHKATRQRNLHVRTYKVIPLSNNSGIIEFVANSIPFTSFLVPAHERYHPQDYKNDAARNKIAAVKDHSPETKIKEFRKVCEHMQPVLRHFFFENFTDPDEWFEKRTAYTRTTATVSILGYVLGLGDRHCQNIMLDEKTGDVVHIDLGIAFEAGRVLPIPELVPFRLTRDVVDGFGITKTEGVFRRCCEFTMDALREDIDSIMTLLNVLRYDPLYSWTVSPLRAQRMQEETGRNEANAVVPENSSRRKEQEASEADRALSIVEKKLSKTLSTAATVNELIQQATDEKNLATLFHGWSAWF